MLEFKWTRKDQNNVPVMGAKDMDTLAESLIRDYKPELLDEPQPIDFEDFLEYYLCVDLQYLDLRLDKPDEKILGMTAFGKDYVIVYDKDSQKLRRMCVDEGTIVLHQQLLAYEQQGRLRFTALHEGSHWWCHRGYFTQPSLQNNGASAAKRYVSQDTSIENFAYRKCSAPVDWIEYQADYCLYTGVKTLAFQAKPLGQPPII